MGVEVSAAVALLTTAAAAVAANEYKKSKDKDLYEGNESYNEKIRQRNKLVEKKNAYSERVKKVFSNTTDLSSGQSVTGNFNSSNDHLEDQNGQRGLFGGAGQNRLQNNE
jgi:hypothetical protein